MNVNELHSIFNIIVYFMISYVLNIELFSYVYNNNSFGHTHKVCVYDISRIDQIMCLCSLPFRIKIENRYNYIQLTSHYYYNIYTLKSFIVYVLNSINSKDCEINRLR